MKKQPDFQKLFYDSFGGKPKKITYEIRSDSNRYHDVVFFTSLIHDATFVLKNIRQRGKRLTIPVLRDCWELPTIQQSDNSEEMYISHTEISIYPVSEIEWRFENQADFFLENELCIQQLWLERKSFDKMIITLDGFYWSCVLNASDKGLIIRMKDIETPYLASEKNKGK